ncbi:MAG: phosphoadenylyl-sulfate reductase [Cyanobacteria bacterium P01_F01_bin.42]
MGRQIRSAFGRPFLLEPRRLDTAVVGQEYLPKYRPRSKRLDLPKLETPGVNLDSANESLTYASAESVIEWAQEQFHDGLVMSTSFGIQSAVMLHLVTRTIPNIPVIWVDTGYLPPATYRFAQALTERLELNLRVYQSPISPARMEAIHGRLWTKDTVESLNFYDQIRKVEPMQRAFRELVAQAWLAGLRSQQTEHRRHLKRVDQQGAIYKVHPILTWSAVDVDHYLQYHNLPSHPFKELGYVTVGDWHSSRPMTENDRHERDTRFQGMKQECGLHLPTNDGEAESFDSSGL